MDLSPFLSSLLFLLVIFFISPLASMNTTAAGINPLIPNVCRQTENPTFCMRFLGSDPRTITVDMKGLQIAIELAAYNATGTAVKVHSLYLGAKDPALRTHLLQCFDYYNDAVNDLKLALDYLRSGRYREINFAAAGSYDDAANCEDEFKKPPAYPSPLTFDNLNSRHLSEIVAVISNILSR